LPIILLSSLGQHHDRFWGLEAGADAYLVKEADTSKLVTEVEKLLETKQNGSAAAAKVLATGDETTDISSKIYDILDKLLFEFTVSNKIRDMFKYAYNSVQLLKNYFELLNNLVDYTIAGIALKTDADNFLTFDIQQSVSKGVLESIINRNLQGESAKDYDLEIFNRQNVVSDEESVAMSSQIVIPLILNNEWRGFISVHSHRAEFFDEQTEKIMKISAKELTNVIQLISNMKEMDTIKAEFASMVVYDMNKPLGQAVDMMTHMVGEKTDEEKLTELQKDALKTCLNLLSQGMDISDNISSTLHKIYADKL